jgi:hypothetical protein
MRGPSPSPPESVLGQTARNLTCTFLRLLKTESGPSFAKGTARGYWDRFERRSWDGPPLTSMQKDRLCAGMRTMTRLQQWKSLRFPYVKRRN